MAIELNSQDFPSNGEIPVRYTCDGDNISPTLTWWGLPEGTQSLALIMDDPDAPDLETSERAWVHWVLYNISPDASRLPENVGREDLPAGTLLGLNDWRRVGYSGPCPATGRHRYFFKLYALDTVLADLNQPDKEQLERAMAAHILEQAELVGHFQRLPQEDLGS